MAIDYNKRPSKPEQPPAATPPAGGGGVSLSKVTLTKSAPSVSLKKGGGGSGQLRVNLQWSTGAAPQKKGLFGRLTGGGGGGVDLDLACLWEFTDGSKGVVQALGNAFQAPYQGAPIIRLDGDDRSGSNVGGENMFIDLSRINEIRRILVFTFIYEGTPNWASADGVVTLFPAGGPEIEVRLDESDPGSPTCVIAMLENRGGELVVNREVRYIRGGQADVDRAYGWGMDWARGRK
ncbi:tellurium resistance protein [Pseudonocardia sp. KRD-184]|uniref:Tellurium resistance protein n=1 Tax=Pseudonocardia oceani TaxID=2792013 RepID=A0ABS6UJ96_9PSEU|nr:tellurium resistance protein [Pseudonocardia oceani]MBW0093845.1 tellurium resistance protein [Pseudonocardia oceani]MBW0100227.1 tellurium resistance protein [Pseudonocardia oceani]MBW0112981.1 tellurium resistance protein [Pseudonocardia oceani]MBW0125852.1 tellurium resistance protein [Pseudonocardia oceani]MBW0132309.1 tellurium resistance protein [Pseudonocardia oceani]